ncbi:octopamine receptor Oamb-like [Patiria miniata]|uniref:G-protein coupled receptors family 1 profile domain-containing protein n=1 Tax=Patiria miniata TaxID=46514 RepID=A0A913Z0V2_PATMI|nr:octopamine receptor Oamb-like [Patiria miniata]
MTSDNRCYASAATMDAYGNGRFNGTLDMNGYNESQSFSVYRSFVERQVLSSVISFISVFGILGNTAVILAVLLVKKLQTSTNVFVLNLAVADVLTCALLPWQVVALLNDELVFPIWLCRTVAFVQLTCSGCNVNTLACIAANSLIGITTPAHSRYRKLFTPLNLSLMVALTWCVPAAVATFPFLSDYAEYGYNPLYNTCVWHSNRSYGLAYAMVLAIMFFPFQFTVLLISYFKIFLYVRKITRTTLRNSGSTNDVDQDLQRRLWTRQLAVTKNLFLVVCAFLFCILPYFVVLGIPGFAKEYLGYAKTILMANSCVNPIIYATRHPDFRLVFGRVLCYKCKRPQTQGRANHNDKDREKKDIRYTAV